MSESAQDTYARLLRRDYHQWVTNQRPIELDLARGAYNPEARANQGQQAASLAAAAFTASAGETDRRLSRMGVQLTPEQAQAAEHSQSRARGLASVDAYNQSGRSFDDRSAALVGGG